MIGGNSENRDGSDRLAAVTDFGFDAFALDPVGEAGHGHPLEIARDLIASGKPRSALDVLSDHHEALADDPEYLLLCAEAWRDGGDALRAQQALLGAARLASDDPRPLLGLAELFAELGQTDKAARARAKARALETRVSQYDSLLPEPEDDLIAFAERRERSTQAALTPKQVLLGVIVIAGVAALIAGIAMITASDDVTPVRPPKKTLVVETASDSLDEMGLQEVAAASSAFVVEMEESPPEPVEAIEEAEAVEQPIVEAPKVLPTPAEPVEAIAPAPARRKPRKRTKPAPAKKAEPEPNKPDPKLVQRELRSMTPEQLTARADALDAEGHTGIAATYYRRALELDPDYAPALVGIGGSTLRAKKYSETMKTATRALELARGVDARPGLEAGAIYQLGRIHYERGDRDGAKRLLRQSISLPRTPAAAWFYLGETFAGESSSAAREAYEKYLELVPEGHLADRARRAIR